MKSIGLALKTSIPFSDESDEESAEGCESKNLTLIKKFMKNKNPKGISFQHKKEFKKNDSNSSNFTCFECSKLGHIKYECSIFLKKQQGRKKKEKNHSKKKRAYIAWDENASSTSSDSSN